MQPLTAACLALPPAQVANAYCDWLQDTSLLVSERWPSLEGGVRLDVRAPNAHQARLASASPVRV